MKKNIKVEKGKKISDVVDERFFVAMVDGEFKDIDYVMNGNEKEIFVYDFDSEEGKKVFWHTSSHILAQAVKRLYPGTKLAIGPAIENGFYYDMEIPVKIGEEELRKIEEEMTKIVEEDLKIVREIWNRDELIEYYRREGNNYKVEILEDMEEDKVSVYRQGEFMDLCKGPHLPRTGLVKAIKLLSVAGAYWRGDERNPMLQRIYGISFPSGKELRKYLNFLEEARARDHRKLGPQLELFKFHEDIGPGLVIWLPRGTVTRKIIEDFLYHELSKRDYHFIMSPHIMKWHLWERSGHASHYRENMFIIHEEPEDYGVKPMNCPAHILVYKSKKRSYRELPLRLAEFGTVYRKERTGVLHGLMRVRGFTQDDAHIFCTGEQIYEEVKNTVDLAFYVLRNFGFEKFDIELSLHDANNFEKYLGEKDTWEKAEQTLEQVLKDMGLEYKRMEGEAAFYGPKIDIKLYDAIGRKWQASTIQFDFNLPERFNLNYTGEDGKEHQVYMIHRALLGSIERFMGILIEHYAGNFPVWIAPVQIRVISIVSDVIPWTEYVYNKLREEGLRAEIDTREEKLSYKISEAEREKIPYMIIIGKKEEENKEVSVRKHGKGNMGNMDIQEFLNLIRDEIQNRR